MKKLFFLFALLFVANMAFAQTQTGGTPVILHPTSQGNDTNEEQTPRSPLTSVYIYQDGHTFTFDSAQVGATISIVKEGEEVYSDIVDLTCTVTIPESVTGTVEIILTQNGITYWAQIVL